MSSYYFQEEHQMFRDSLRAFLDAEVRPNIDQWEEDRQIPKELWKKMGAQGYLGLGYPEEYGGSSLDFFYDVIFCEETSKCFSGGFGITQMVVQYMSGPYILKYGSEELKKKYLPGIISGDLISCIGITEPGAGSDAANIQTRAIAEGDYYRVNGSKTFITNGVYGDLIVTVVKTNPDAGSAGVSLLVIDRNAEGVSARKLKKLGWHASDTAELSFDNVMVPRSNLIGAEGQGFYYLMGGLQLERLVGAIGAYAACESALAYSLQYMSEREAFGRTINRFQVLRHRVAQMASEIEATKQFVLHCCRLHQDQQYAVKESSMAKLLATELSDKVMYQCLQFFGGYGFMEEYKMARLFRDSRVGTIGGGSSEIMREIIAKMVIDDVGYKAAKGGSDFAPPAAKPKSDAPGSKSESNQIVGLDAILEFIQKKAETMPAFGHKLKFDLGENVLVLDGSGDANQISRENIDADCTVKISEQDFAQMISGALNPMNAMMAGKLQIDGDMSVAMKLQSLFS